MTDLRTPFMRWLDRVLGLPLYYSSRCRLRVRVRVTADGVDIARPCGVCDCEVMAPRKSILAGEGGLNFVSRVRMRWYRLAAALTGRCV
jgi:hypothetical protein